MLALLPFSTGYHRLAMSEIAIGPTFDVRLHLFWWKPRWRGRKSKRREKRAVEVKAPKPKGSKWYDGFDVPDLEALFWVVLIGLSAFMLLAFILPALLLALEVAFLCTLGAGVVACVSFVRKRWTLVVYERGKSEPVTRYTEPSWRVAWRMARTDTAPAAVALPLLGLGPAGERA